jgi:hypothetical protein
MYRPWLVFLSMLAAAILGCRAQRQPPPVGVASVDPELLASQLELAYRASSDEQLTAFLDRWHNSIEPADVTEIQDPLERELYLLFRNYYDPSDLHGIAGDDCFPDTLRRYKNTRYVIVQNTLRYQIGDEVTEEERTITNFRPGGKVADRRVLYLTPPYREALSTFLDAEDIPGNEDYSESIKRMEFLSRFVMVSASHVKGWDLVTPPYVMSVDLGETTKEATVHFRILSEGGRSSMRRTPEEWQMTKTGLYWQM